MTQIRVGETRRPETSKRKGDPPRKKRQKNAAKILADRKKEGIPAATRVARIAVTIRPAPGLLRECPHCGHENWKWLDTCAGPGCHKAITPAPPE